MLFLPVLAACVAQPMDRASLTADRAAIERVYYNHRLGQKPPFDQVLPPDVLENLVRQDQRKESVLKEVYGFVVTAAMLDAEVARINTTTRAPEMLAEIKLSLGNDPARFANAFAKPIVVDRVLRQKFDNDTALHAGVRRQIEQTRSELLDAKKKGAGYDTLHSLLKQHYSSTVNETIWQLGPPPAQTKDKDMYFEDLHPELQQVLRAQLRQPGDVSAVIETPAGFLLYVAKHKTMSTMSAAVLSLPKRSYEQWLQEQSIK